MVIPAASCHIWLEAESEIGDDIIHWKCYFIVSGYVNWIHLCYYVNSNVVSSI
jgi:hypothetical protein